MPDKVQGDPTIELLGKSRPSGRETRPDVVAIHTSGRWESIRNRDLRREAAIVSERDVGDSNTRNELQGLERLNQACLGRNCLPSATTSKPKPLNIPNVAGSGMIPETSKPMPVVVKEANWPLLGANANPSAGTVPESLAASKGISNVVAELLFATTNQ